MLKKRLLTALILIPITLLFIVYLNPLMFSLVSLAVIALGMWEWTNLIKIKLFVSKLVYIISLLVVSIFSFFFLPAQFVFFLGVLWWLYALFLIRQYPGKKVIDKKHRTLAMTAGYFIFIPCWYGINWLRNALHTPAYLFILLALVWGMDSGAYFAGKLWGHRKLMPEISPGKTVMGLIGGLIVSLIVGVISGFVVFDFNVFQFVLWVVCCLLVASISVVGDLFESMVKRTAAKKDSSHLLPGHGGLLDRIDSLLAATPYFAFFLPLFLNVRQGFV